jgi:Fe-Mn family superoxide dismutase
MVLHHSKHHQTYVNNLNIALQAQSVAASSKDIVEQLNLQSAVRFSAGSHINHTLFWENLAPPSSTSEPGSPCPGINAALKERWNSVDGFKENFEDTLLTIQGSGWGWLVQDAESGYLDIITTKDQDIVPKGKKPLLGVDMWEHAYYLQYLNNKKDYIRGIWHVINWPVVEKKFLASSEAVFGLLQGLNSVL